MVESLSSHKIIQAARDADEADVVACIAAVTAYMKLEEEEWAAAAAKKDAGETRSPWGQTALLEGAQVGTGFIQSAPNRFPLWRNFPGVFWIALSLAGLLSGFGAHSVSADTEYGEDFVVQDGEVIYTAQAPPRAGWRPYGGPQAGQDQSGRTLIKVALVLGAGEISVDAVDGAKVLDMSNGQHIAQLQPLSQWKLGSRTANGAPAIAITGRRGVDKYLIATGNQLMSGNERNVAFFPQQYIGPPALKAFENSPQMAGAAQAKPAVASLLVTCSPKPPSLQTSTQAPQAAPGAQPPQTAPRVTSGTQQAPPVAPRISFGAQPSGSLPVSLGAAQAPQSVPQTSALAAPRGDVPDSDSGDFDETENAADQVSSQPIETMLSEPGKFSGITNGVIITPNAAGADNTQSVFNLNGRMYRGSLWVKPEVVKDKNGTSVTRLTAINIIDLEDYLMSVLPSEMPSAWPHEALKAQAIAARSYAIANLGKYRSQGYDVKATVLDQAYRGAVAETIASNKAIAETRGIVMKHDGKVVPGFFHSSSAGHTDVAEHVWTKEVPYLKSVPDVDHKSKYVLWERKFPTPQIDNILGKDVGNVLGLFPVHRSPSGRVKNLLVIGSKGTTFVPGTTVRQLFALPSTNFNVLAYQDAYLFKGQGFGHGLGMSQYGARSLAEHGYNAAQILAYYYKDVTFEHIVDTPAL